MLNKNIFISVYLCAFSFTTHAALIDGAQLNFDPGIITCLNGGTPPYNCDQNATQVGSGSYFLFDMTGNDILDGNPRIPISALEGLITGSTQTATGSFLDGTAAPAIDNVWEFIGLPGMHSTISPVTSSKISEGVYALDFTGWGQVWSQIPFIPLGGDAATFGTTGNPGDADSGMALLICDTADCVSGSRYTLDYVAHVPLNVTVRSGELYGLHLEGTVSAVPIPATIWLLLSGAAGLLGFIKRPN